jgi:sarcosine oxidase subunit beta
MEIGGSETGGRRNMRIIIIGGGVQGMACAFALAKRGVDSIILLEAQRIGYGASSRNGGGIRAQFRHEVNIRLAIWSMRLFDRLTADLGYQILLHHSGYMYLHFDEKTARQAEQEAKLHNRLGVRTRLISPREVSKIVPGLNTQGMLFAQYNPDDASCHHDALLWAYLRVLRRMGVEIREKVEVIGLEKQGGRIIGARVTDRLIKGDQVIVAAGAWSKKLLNTVGVVVPTQPWRREQMVAESMQHFLKPFVIDKQRGISFHQTIRGEILGNAHVPVHEPSMNWNATRPLIETFSRYLYNLFPALTKMSIIRQWAGTRDFTPDGTPIFGPMPSVEGLWAICGQSGVGFMLAPAIAEAIAQAIVGRDPGVDFEIYSPRRFELGRELWERSPHG